MYLLTGKKKPSYLVYSSLCDRLHLSNQIRINGIFNKNKSGGLGVFSVVFHFSTSLLLLSSSKTGSKIPRAL